MFYKNYQITPHKPPAPPQQLSPTIRTYPHTSHPTLPPTPLTITHSLHQHPSVSTHSPQQPPAPSAILIIYSPAPSHHLKSPTLPTLLHNSKNTEKPENTKILETGVKNELRNKATLPHQTPHHPLVKITLTPRKDPS